MQLDDDGTTPTGAANPRNPGTTQQDPQDVPESINVQLVADVMAEVFNKEKEASEATKSTRRIAKAANATLLPHGSSALPISIGAFVKALMGIPTNGGKLPMPPTQDEHSRLENHRDIRRRWVQEQIEALQNRFPGPHSQSTKQFFEKTALAEIRKKISPVHFTPPPAHLLAEANKSFGLEAIANTLAELAHAGISRCTYDWDLPNSTLWNTTISSVVLYNWNVWYLSAPAINAPLIDGATNNHVIRLGCLKRWFSGRKRDWHKQQLLEVVASPEMLVTATRVEKAKRRSARQRVS